jgi:hypothetical protein
VRRGDVLVPVDVLDAQARDLRPSDAGVEEKPQDRAVSAIVERRAGGGLP